MKTFFILLSLAFLASCTAEAPSDEVSATPEVTVQEQTLSDIDEATANLPDTQEVVDELLSEVDEIANDESEATVVELSTTYRNPTMEVIMDIEYSLDTEGKISEISLTSPNFEWISRYNDGVQPVIWMTVEQASEYVISGSSYATPAFQAALKESL